MRIKSLARWLTATALLRGIFPARPRVLLADILFPVGIGQWRLVEIATSSATTHIFLPWRVNRRRDRRRLRIRVTAELNATII